MKLIDKLSVIVWNIGFIEENIEEIFTRKSKNKITWMKHKYKDRFFADPFILGMTDKEIILLVEEYLFVEGKGKIVKLIIDKKNKHLLERTLLIESEYHLSYPFIYNDLIIPEQSESKSWISYNQNGEKHEMISKEGFIDGTIFNDGSNEWLFTTKIVNEKKDANSKLFRYKIYDGKVDMSTEKLIKDTMISSRPGGSFFEFNGNWYRIAQNSSEKNYGEAVSICKIKVCNDKDYCEELVSVINSKKEKRYNRGVHTFNIGKGFIVVDGWEMQLHPIQKIKYKLLKRSGNKNV